MKFSDQYRYNIMIQKVMQKEEESALNYIKLIQNAKALVLSMGNSYTKNQLMLTFFKNPATWIIIFSYSNPPSRIVKRRKNN